MREPGSVVCPTDLECVFSRPNSMTDCITHYCPGCSHGVFHRLVGELLDEFALTDRAIMVCPVGCAAFAYRYFECDQIQASHGRAPAVATGVKRPLPDRFVFTYQGDGDLASIGMSETIHAAARGEPITVFFVNNGIFGMTGGQMAPTTLAGQVTTTSVAGRACETTGRPLDVCKLLSSLPGVAFLARASLATPRQIHTCRSYMRKAIRAQLEGKGFGLVEALGTCPTQWHMSPTACMDHIDQVVVKEFPPGVFVDRVDDPAPESAESAAVKRGYCL
ncbi:MAG: thiamine pyrophosphate-dependent enzyme [Phycisphaerae bacterium]